MSLLDQYHLPDSDSGHSAAISKVFEAVGYSSTNSTTSSNHERKQAIAQRLRLYKNNARVDMYQMIDAYFTDEKVKDQRRKLIPYTRYQNISKRIVDEVASLYDLPALRQFPSPADTEAYRAIVKECGLDNIAQHAQRMLMLCGNVLVWLTKSSTNKRKLRVVTPDMFSVVVDADSEVSAIILDRKPAIVGEMNLTANSDQVCYDIWDDTYRYQVGADGRIHDVTAHELGRIPGVLLHSQEPAIGQPLQTDNCSDIAAAHLQVWLINIMLARLAKSQGERQPFIVGDGVQLARNQSADGESPLILPSSVTRVDMLDSVTDPDHFIAHKKDVIASVGQTYGLSYEQISYTGDTSGASVEARREKLKELRNEQRRRANGNERLICELLGFDSTNLTADFSEQTMPLNEQDSVALVKSKSELGLDSPVAYLMRKDPDLTVDAAIAQVEKNIQHWTMVKALMPVEIKVPVTAG